MQIIALTGTVAAGKSTVAALFRRWGATVIDADAIVRELQQPGQPVLTNIVSHFGISVVAPDGTLLRGKLREIILNDPVARRDLEGIVHPAVERRRRELLDAAKSRGDRLVIVEIPLLFESADPTAYQGVIVVDASTNERRRRLIEERQLPVEQADQLLQTQLSGEAKRAGATWVIENDGDLAALEHAARELWDRLNR